MSHVHRPLRAPIEDHQTERSENPDKSRSHCHNQLPQLQRRFRRILLLIQVSFAIFNYFYFSITYDGCKHLSFIRIIIIDNFFRFY